jgi:nitrite reductase/ring-hydroxylating ferredoxin subunit
MAFVRVAALDDLAVNAAMAAEVDGVPVCIVRLDADLVKAVHNTCSHEDYPAGPTPSRRSAPSPSTPRSSTTTPSGSTWSSS